ncbi:MAG: multiheme c-type cytochrome, partial [Campylobacterota bacterium]|nr:multiheme c-type cytochrome [Campylobacterota bacterium]
MTKKIFLTLTLLTAIMAEDNASYIGDKSCVECHSKEVQEWKGSHHDLAMKEANSETVVGDFDNATFELHGVKSSFYKKDGKFFIRTDGEDGKLQDFEVAYTFGIYPLQQYLLKFPDGKYQVPDIAWDSRSKEEGGQRWYHIHKDEVIKAGDVLHWTGPNFNWNYMCADCHSTNLKKNYDPKSKSYHTTWDVINVSCEACHGPASKHIAWSKNHDKDMMHKGFPLSFKNKKWKWDVKTTDKIEGQRGQEIEVCAKCHSRRSQLDDNYTPGDKYHDHYLPSMLEQSLYFPDGKIQDEVYVYDSFLQSKMYAEGVTCSDCHNPHTLERKSKGDKVCYQCHSEEKYTSKSHHFHNEGSSGASCIDCHMPARTYMGVDSRNDHSFRIPRPDISVEMKEIPNACNLCHTDKDAKWATEAMKEWYGKIPVGKQNFAHSLKALRNNSEDAPKELYKVLMSDAPDIAKATATAYLGNYPSRQTYTTTLQMLRNKDGNIRRSALQAMETFPPQMRIKETFKMLKDPLKTVRMEAARQLSAFPRGEMGQANRTVLEKVLEEYKTTLLFNADRPESQLSLATLYTNTQMPQKAEEAYREALRLQPMFVPIYINYSDFLQKQGKPKEAFEIIQQGVAKVPNIGVLHHALGLWYVRNKETGKAVTELKKAMELDKNDARISYVYAVSIGEENPAEAIKILEEVYKKHTGDLQIVSGLAYYY